MVYRHYSPDLKVVVVRNLLRGQSYHQINAVLGRNIHPDSMKRWLGLYTMTRAVVLDPLTYRRRGPSTRLTSEQRQFLTDVLDNDPDLYLDEVQLRLADVLGVNISRQTLSIELRCRLGLTHKVARSVHPNQSEAARASYIREVSHIPPDYLVFVDESAICVDGLQRRYAWSKKGRPTQRLHRTREGKRFSLLPAVSHDGVLATMVQEGPILRLDFEYFLKYRLLPVMNPWPGRNSVLIVDNARIHHNGRIQELCELRGILLKYLPAYSPDLNPIEKGFSVLKAKLRRVRLLTGAREDASVITRVCNVVMSPTLIQTLFRVCGY